MPIETDSKNTKTVLLTVVYRGAGRGLWAQARLGCGCITEVLWPFAKSTTSRAELLSWLPKRCSGCDEAARRFDDQRQEQMADEVASLEPMGTVEL